MKSKRKFKQEMREYFERTETQKLYPTFEDWFNELWTTLDSLGYVIKIGRTFYVIIEK